MSQGANVNPREEDYRVRSHVAEVVAVSAARTSDGDMVSIQCAQGMMELALDAVLVGYITHLSSSVVSVDDLFCIFSNGSILEMSLWPS